MKRRNDEVSSCEALASAFARVPLHIYGAYRTKLEANHLYCGHVDQPTTKCGIVCGLKGQAEFIFDARERYQLEPGKILLGGLHKQLEVCTGGNGFEYYLVHYLPVSSELEEVRRLTKVSILHIALDPELLQLHEDLLRASSSPGSLELLKKKMLFYRLLNKLIQSARHQQNKETDTLIDETIQYIQTHYAEPLTLNMLAERYQVKAKYFSYLFHKYVGIGPIDFLIQYRMNKAYELLITGQFPVSSVAKSVGYSDAYYFSRLFKKHKGLPPSKVGLYRKRNNPS
ncbi:AraC family transcriptional regulator [Pueribacillus theae]|uniref:AraC family transcriptional regulator n=1 Tax=Pueribacillus theae TaxID=2171751 RepID=A0A2U1K685_9BACI|nr:AraC family transcriptional regulator [Pueribacillus theae]PWA12902.1 AraC family transcriptional regulator [Pueribacillus theae]